MVSDNEKKRVRKRTKCPKCGCINTTDCQSECPECGVIYRKVIEKAFKDTIVTIGNKGLEHAESELNKLANRFPALRTTCDQYTAFINHALKKYTDEKYNLSTDYFEKLVKKQPALHKAIIPFLEPKETQEKNSDQCEPGDISTIEVKEKHIESTLGKQKKLNWSDFSNKKISKKETIAFVTVFFIAVIILSQGENSGLESKSYKKDIKYTVSPTSNPKPQATSRGYAETVAAVLNRYYGEVCHAEVSGIFRRTLKIDWTRNTNKFASIKVFAEVGNVRAKLYEDGVRYFQFPNDACTYNVIDWKTGEKKSISERAPYCFRN
ncbi:MAG: hypothetical protein D3918_02625 [Candidatus Electrothrix sp. AX2]|nr:hypothetical protein [Candidatus Electrothrix gigas]